MKRELEYYNDRHKANCVEIFYKLKSVDRHHNAVAYLLGLPEIFPHAEELFDFGKDCVKAEGLFAAWQNDSTKKATRLIFSIWGYCGDIEIGGDSPREYSAAELFNCKYSVYFYEAMRLLYPQYAD